MTTTHTFIVAGVMALLGVGCEALGSDELGTPGELLSMMKPCEVGTIEDIVMPSGSIVISVLNVTAVDEPSDGGDGFDLNKPMLQWAQSTGRFLNVTCETDEILIFYMEV